jgi:hypothetical protein
MAFGDVMVGYMLLWQARVASEKLRRMQEEAGAPGGEGRTALAATNPEAAFYLGKIGAARFFAAHVVPEVEARCRGMRSGERSALTLPENAF